MPCRFVACIGSYKTGARDPLTYVQNQQLTTQLWSAQLCTQGEWLPQTLVSTQAQKTGRSSGEIGSAAASLPRRLETGYAS